jgi:Holliday junction DNA helicase RuvA
MIAFLTGQVLQVQAARRYIIVRVGDIGYKVFVPAALCAPTILNQTVSVYTYHIVREDADDLFGFKEPAELDLFERLLSVSGVGPKVALALLSQLSAAELRVAITQGDLLQLTSVSGVGKKTAERLVVELKQTLLEGAEDFATLPSISAEVASALQGLGYSANEIRLALQQVDHDLEVGVQLKAALAWLSRHGK